MKSRNIKSQSGVTMISLIIYVASFLAITMLISGITTFFYNNVDALDTKNGSSSQYNRLNVFMLKECKRENNTLIAWQNQEEVAGTVDKKTALNLSNQSDIIESFLTFADNSDSKYSFIYIASEKCLYYSSNANSNDVLIRLCDNVNEFKFKVDYTTGKTTINLYIDIDGTAYSTEYVVSSS